MAATIQLGEVVIAMTTKAIKHVHLSVHPPQGHVTLVAPIGTRVEVARAYAASRLGWIRAQQAKLLTQARESPRRFVTRESHYVWGRRYLLSVVEKDEKPWVRLEPRRITLSVRPGSTQERRERVMHEWHKALLHEVVPSVIERWERILHVEARGYFLQRMKTKWGSCNCRAGHIRLNTELVKKPKDLLEYVVAHEMTHLLEPTHGERFVAILDRHLPHWREARQELNELPLSDDLWRANQICPKIVFDPRYA
jgi:predicted metal-dependent hydrolase